MAWRRIPVLTHPRPLTGGLLLATALVSSACIDGLSGSAPSANPGTPGCVVARVIDGDTIHIDGCDDAGRVRLLLIDTPEVHPDLECLGREATAYTEDALLGRTVSLERDVRDTDPFNRQLRYVWLDGELFNERIVADGFARQVTFPPDVKYLDRVRAAQQRARAANLGIWSPSRCP